MIIILKSILKVKERYSTGAASTLLYGLYRKIVLNLYLFCFFLPLPRDRIGRVFLLRSRANVSQVPVRIYNPVEDISLS